MSCPDLLEDVSHSVRSGEILGAGHTELLKTIFGARMWRVADEIQVEGDAARIENPSEAMARIGVDY